VAKVSDVVRRALASVLVAGSEAELYGDDNDDAIFELNNFMSELAAKGVELGYTDVASPSEEITVPAGVLSGIITNLAIRIAPQYGGHISEALVASAMAGMNAIYAAGITTPTTALPGNLNTGVASQNYSVGQFYSGE
jgi:hypothetical protein